jgi:hypothetical protein
MTEEDEAFNDIERMSNIRKESVKMTMLKPKTAEEFYSELREKALNEVRAEYEERLDKAYGEAKKIILGLRDDVAILEFKVLRLEMEVTRCHKNEELEIENHRQFDRWIEEYLIVHGLSRHIKPLQDFLGERVSED